MFPNSVNQFLFAMVKDRFVRQMLIEFVYKIYMNFCLQELIHITHY